MKEDKSRVLLSYDYIKTKLPQIIEAFVSYYGEERREELTDRLNNTLILKFSTLQDLERNIENVYTSSFKEVFEIPEKKYVYLNVNELTEFFTDNKEGSYYSISESIKEIIAGDKNISNDELLNNFKEGAYPKLKEFLEKSKEITTQLSPYIESLENEKEKQKQIEQKYYEKLVEEFKYLFTEDEINAFKTSAYKSKTMYLLLGTSINNDGNCFDEESDKLLSNPESSNWRKESIKDDRADLINLFYRNNNTSSLNKPTYDELLEDPKCIEFIGKLKPLMEKISNRKKELYKQMHLEKLESLKDYQTNREIINNANLVNKDDPLGPMVYDSPISCCSNNFTMTPNGLKLTPLVLINSGMSNLDQVLIHELNHAIETHIMSINGNKIQSTCGWEIFEEEISDVKSNQDEQYSGISRGYELLSEYVNDRIAEEITVILHSKDDYIFDKNNKSTSSYKVVFPLVEEFFVTFKEIIIKSRSNGNINVLFDYIGKENFEELNSVVNEFYNAFGFGFGAMQAVTSYYNKSENEQAKQLGEMINKKDEILAKMKEHLKSKTL